MSLSDAAGIVYAGIPGFMPAQYPPDYQLGALEQKYGVGFNLNSAIKTTEPSDHEDVCAWCDGAGEHFKTRIAPDGGLITLCDECWTKHITNKVKP